MKQQQIPPPNTEIHFQDIKTALLVGVIFSAKDKPVCEEHLQELERLCDTYGIQAVNSVICSIKKFDAGHYIGSGKIEEIKVMADELKVDAILFDDEISPQQQRNLEKLFQKPVIDRTELILEVFAQRAQTKEAKLQIELAKIKYQFPRLKRLWTHLSRQSSSGGGFVKGEGEKQIEIDKRLLRRRLDRLRTEIKEVVKNREMQRHARVRAGIPTIAIVGYTNAGKSTLLNALTHAGVLAEDKLFATLDTTTRKFCLSNHQEILLIDTVGFIRKIPHTLVAAFKSTLEEVAFTDILLHLIDISHPAAEQQAQECLAVLKELNAHNKPIITVLNKIDACEDRGMLTKMKITYPKSVSISAKTGEGFDLLDEMLVHELSQMRKIVHLRIPQSQYALVSELMRDGKVISSDYEENDVILHVEIPCEFEHKVLPFKV